MNLFINRLPVDLDEAKGIVGLTIFTTFWKTKIQKLTKGSKELVITHLVNSFLQFVQSEKLSVKTNRGSHRRSL
jgi:hypothetical protein